MTSEADAEDREPSKFAAVQRRKAQQPARRERVDKGRPPSDLTELVVWARRDSKAVIPPKARSNSVHADRRGGPGLSALASTASSSSSSSATSTFALDSSVCDSLSSASGRFSQIAAVSLASETSVESRAACRSDGSPVWCASMRSLSSGSSMRKSVFPLGACSRLRSGACASKCCEEAKGAQAFVCAPAGTVDALSIEADSLVAECNPSKLVEPVAGDAAGRESRAWRGARGEAAEALSTTEWEEAVFPECNVAAFVAGSAQRGMAARLLDACRTGASRAAAALG
eukprot:6195949-Pleurochrysis_carterae.AAC.2